MMNKSSSGVFLAPVEISNFVLFFLNIRVAISLVSQGGIRKKISAVVIGSESIS